MPRRSEQRRRLGHGIRTGIPFEAETASEPDHVHGRAVGGLGTRVPQVSVSGRVHQRGVGPKVRHRFVVYLSIFRSTPTRGGGKRVFTVLRVIRIATDALIEQNGDGHVTRML